MAAGRLVAKLRGTTTNAVMARGAVGAFAVQLAGAAALFALHYMLGRMLGTAQYGDFVVAAAWIQVLLLPSKLGFDTAAVRYVAAYRGHGQWDLLRGFVRSSYLLVGCTAVTASAAALAITWLIRGHLSPELSRVLTIAWLAVPVAALVEVSAAHLRGLKRAIIAPLPAQVLRPLVVLAAVSVMALVVVKPVTAFDAMLANAAAFALAMGVTLALLHWSWPREMSLATPNYRPREWLGVAAPLLLYASMYLVLGQTDTLMLGAMRGTSDAGIYGLANRLSTLVSFGLMAVNMIAAPLISELYTQKRLEELQRMVTLAAWGVLAFTLPVAAGLVALGLPILGSVGSGFTAGYPTMIVLIAGQMVNALAGSVGLLMTMTGHQRRASMVMATAAATNVILNLALIPPFGIIGAAVATAVTKIMWNVLMLYYVWKRLRINPTVLRFHLSSP